MNWKPPAPKGTKCPLWRKDVSKVCHECEWYDRIEGQHPQTGERIDRWMCGINRLILLQIETARQASGTSDAVISFRNEMAQANEQTCRLIAAAAIRPNASPPILIQDRN